MNTGKLNARRMTCNIPLVPAWERHTRQALWEGDSIIIPSLTPCVQQSPYRTITTLICIFPSPTTLAPEFFWAQTDCRGWGGHFLWFQVSKCLWTWATHYKIELILYFEFYRRNWLPCFFKYLTGNDSTFEDSERYNVSSDCSISSQIRAYGGKGWEEEGVGRVTKGKKREDVRAVR